jgi:hypothetical protein
MVCTKVRVCSLHQRCCVAPPWRRSGSVHVPQWEVQKHSSRLANGSNHMSNRDGRHIQRAAEVGQHSISTSTGSMHAPRQAAHLGGESHGLPLQHPLALSHHQFGLLWYIAAVCAIAALTVDACRANMTQPQQGTTQIRHRRLCIRLPCGLLSTKWQRSGSCSASRHLQQARAQKDRAQSGRTPPAPVLDAHKD